MNEGSIQSEEEEELGIDLFERVLALRNVEIFSETPEEILLELAEVCEEKTFTAGEVIFEEGDIGNSMYILVEGRVELNKGSALLSSKEKGSFFGEFALINPGPRSTSAVVNKLTRVIIFDRPIFYEIMADRIDIVQAMLQYFIDLINKTTVKLEKANNELTQYKKTSSK